MTGPSGSASTSGAAIGAGPDLGLPAWSAPFAKDHRADLRRLAPLGRLDRDWAFGDGRGEGVTVAIVDSGVEGDHPAVGGALTTSVRVEMDGEDASVVDDEPVDVVGHGTACASIIHGLAPAAEILSVRVLGPDNRGKGAVFAAGLDWAIERGADVINLSLSSRSDALYSVRVEMDGEDASVVDDEPIDVVGHGTACASIIHGLAPAAEIVSVRVLGPDNRGKGAVFAAGLDWAIERGADVINLSLSSRSDALYSVFHELADRAYFAGVLLVCAANNIAVASYPSLFAAVVSVAAHDVRDPAVWFYNPKPPVEFGAFGLDVDVAWKGGGRIVATGNSFAAPHVSGYAARIRATHPGASPFEVKTVLAATADEPPA